MELELSSILKDCRKGTRLYSPICGELVLSEVSPNGIFCKQRNTAEDSKNLVFMDDGHFKNYGEWEDFGECMLFPSKQQRDWSKFFKYGDVLRGNGMIVIFEDWVDGSYTEFNTAYDYYTQEDSFGKDEVCLTERFEKVSEAEKAEFIKKIEAKEGGIYDKYTLEVRPKSDFKDGDIIYSEWTNEEKNTHCSWVAIFKGGDKECYYTHALLYLQTNELDLSETSSDSQQTSRLATEEEQARLFYTLSRKGKEWNAEKKQIEDIPAEFKFQPFDKVLVRDNPMLAWKPAIFINSDREENFPYRVFCLSREQDTLCRYCIPYAGNEHLAGTNITPKEEAE